MTHESINTFMMNHNQPYFGHSVCLHYCILYFSCIFFPYAYRTCLYWLDQTCILSHSKMNQFASRFLLNFVWSKHRSVQFVPIFSFYLMINTFLGWCVLKCYSFSHSAFVRTWAFLMRESSFVIVVWTKVSDVVIILSFLFFW